MKIYRFAVHPESDGIYFLECVNDPKLFTQAHSMDEAIHMARDVAATVYDEKDVQIELVVPPDVQTSFDRRRRPHTARGGRKPKRAAITSR
jgi:predicted RNase H-like HicB family nuclease